MALWCGGRAAAAQEVGISKCCQALSAAAQSRAFVLPFAKDLEDVSSTVVSAMVRCQVMNSGFRRVRRADISGSVLGLRFDEALKPHREDGQVAAGGLSVKRGPWETGFRLPNGWTSPAVTSRWPPMSSSGRLMQAQQLPQARNWWNW